MGGEQALYVTAQMPTGVPVATVGVDAAMNAAVLAAQIVGVADPDVQKRLWRFKDDLAEGLRCDGPLGRAVIPGTPSPEMAAVWSEEAKLGHWLEIEMLVAEAWARLGVVPDEDARAIRERRRSTPSASAEVERVTRHDVAAFVQVVAESVGPAGRWVHFGLTSSDVLDTGLALQLRDARDLLLDRLERLLGVTKRLALEHRDTVMAGRTHGVVAEPTSFGHKVALWAFELDRDRDRLRRARETVSVGAISGVVGTYAQVDPRVEEEVCARLGLRPAEASSQIVARDRHAELMGARDHRLDARRIATEIRHLARTEVREVQEPFARGQKGSSAMPHKRNPVRCERSRASRGWSAGTSRRRSRTWCCGTSATSRTRRPSA